MCVGAWVAMCMHLYMLVGNLVCFRTTVVFCSMLTYLRGFPEDTFKEMKRSEKIHLLYLLYIFSRIVKNASTCLLL